MDQQAIKKMAELAKLSFNDEELELLEQQFVQQEELIAQMQSVDTTEVSPTYRGIDLVNITRADEPQIVIGRDQLMQNVKCHKDGYIQVPAIMNDGNEGA